MAHQLAPIRVNSLAPGPFVTERFRTLDAAGAEGLEITVGEQRAQASKAIPLGCYGEPEELGRFAAVLLSPATS